MLDACLDKNVSIVDYECISDSGGNRLVAFGHWAGIAGAINGISLMGMRLLAYGHNTPLIRIVFWSVLQPAFCIFDKGLICRPPVSAVLIPRYDKNAFFTIFTISA